MRFCRACEKSFEKRGKAKFCFECGKKTRHKDWLRKRYFKISGYVGDPEY